MHKISWGIQWKQFFLFLSFPEGRMNWERCSMPTQIFISSWIIYHPIPSSNKTHKTSTNLVSFKKAAEELTQLIIWIVVIHTNTAFDTNWNIWICSNDTHGICNKLPLTNIKYANQSWVQQTISDLIKLNCTPFPNLWIEHKSRTKTPFSSNLWAWTTTAVA